MAIDTTIGGAVANSYATVDEFKAYWLTRLIPSGQDEPGSFGDSDIENALMMATSELDREGWLGDAVSSEQALSWPRVSVYNRNGYIVASDSIPQPIKDATCELAYALLLDPEMTSDDGFDRFSHVSLNQGEVDLTIRQGVSGGLPSKVTRLISEFLSGRGARVLRA
jgi:hypothetical protein